MDCRYLVSYIRFAIALSQVFELQILLVISVINIATFFFKWILLYIKLGFNFLFKLLPIFLAGTSSNSLYKFLLIFLSKISPNFEFLLIFLLEVVFKTKFFFIFLSKVGSNSLYEFLSIFFISKKLLSMLLFTSKYYFFFAKFLSLFDLLFFWIYFLVKISFQLVLVLL